MLIVNEGKSKIMRIGKNGEEDEVNVSVNGKRMEEVEIYRYLGVDISNDSGMDEEVNHRIGEARRAWGALKDVWKKRHISREAKVGMYEGIIEPSLLYGCETWALNVKDRKRREAVEMNCLRNICGRRRIDRVPNVRIREMCGKNVGVMRERIRVYLGGLDMLKEWKMRGWLKRVY